VVIGVTAASVAIAAAIWFIASGKTPTPNVFIDTSTSQQDMSLSYGMKEYTMEKTQMGEAATSPFFKVLPWRLTSERQSSGVLEFCSDGNETYGYGSLGDCIPGQPSPLIRMKPRHHYQLTLVNNAHIDTNLHTHGLHVSGVGKLL
jgi:FtsP/CotA-like multicopper oxidase with cupredoxin domain